MADPQAVASTCHYVGLCALNTADQAAWAGAIGSLVAGAGAFFAAWAALRVAGVERRVRQRERADNGVVSASFIYADMSKLASYGCELHRVAIELSEIKPGAAIANHVLTIHQTASPMKQMAERTSLEWINALPVDVAINLSRSVGAFPFPCDLIDSTVDAWGMMLMPMDEAQTALRVHAEGLRVPLRRLVRFFEWYGNVMPESSMAAAGVIKFIYEEVGRPLDDGAPAEQREEG